MNKTDIPQDPNLRWEWIKFQLRTRGTSFAKLARDLAVSNSAVKNAKKNAYPRMERAIAKALDLTPADLWPERWNINGTPYRTRTKRAEHNATYGQQHTGAYVLQHCKTSEEV